MINIVIYSVQKWLPFEKILEDGIIKLKNNNYVMIIKVKPINYNLKSKLEKEAILNSYKIFFKTCPFDIQIIIQSQKENLEEHINKINIVEEENKKIIKIKEKYIQNIQKLNSINKSDSKQFFILIKQSKNNNKEEICIEQLNEKYFKIKEALSRCGNSIYCVNKKEEVIEILKKYFLGNKINKGGK